MNLRQLVLAVGLGFAATATAAPQDGPAREYVYMLSAGELRGVIDQGQRNLAIYYISGVMDALMRSRDYCVPAGANPGEIGARAYTLMSQQPRESLAPAADVIAVFLHADYPCK